MKTIEERAAELAKEFGSTKANKESAIYRACIRMGEEQKKIDIDKACKWLQNNIWSYMHSHIRTFDGENGELIEEVIPDVFIEMFHYFKIAMNKEL